MGRAQRPHDAEWSSTKFVVRRRYAPPEAATTTAKRAVSGTRVPAPPSDGGAGRETWLYRFGQRSTRLRPPHAYEYVAQPTFEEMNSRTFWLFVITSGDWFRVMSMSSVP
jgi:hypothetical protein